jgi:hypothetical protein
MLAAPLSNYNPLHCHHPCRANLSFICTPDGYRDAERLVGLPTLDDDTNVNKVVTLQCPSQIIQTGGKLSNWPI